LSVSAQSPSDQQWAVSIVHSVGQHAYTDLAAVNYGGLIVVGWAFECSSSSSGDVDLLIDGVPFTPPYGSSWRSERSDVWTSMVGAGVCPASQTAYWSGYNAVIDVASLGLASGPHSVQLRVKNGNGVITPADSARSFLVP
jgi:hypothetical protein